MNNRIKPQCKNVSKANCNHGTAAISQRKRFIVNICLNSEKKKREKFSVRPLLCYEMLFWCSWAKVTTSSTSTATIIIILVLELVPQHFLYSCPFWIVDIVIGCYPTLESRNTVINPSSIFFLRQKKKKVLTLVLRLLLKIGLIYYGTIFRYLWPSS